MLHRRCYREICLELRYSLDVTVSCVAVVDPVLFVTGGH